jgi:hypothetical protein
MRAKDGTLYTAEDGAESVRTVFSELFFPNYQHVKTPWLWGDVWRRGFGGVCGSGCAGVCVGMGL